jgi:dolichyl-phosphate beta-glucosyltransferase
VAVKIIIVDDGSKDNTAKVGFEYVKKYTLDVVRVLKQVVNQGKGAAVRKGMLCSRGQLLLMLDADGATKITDLEKLESQVRVLDVLAQNLLYSFKSI